MQSAESSGPVVLSVLDLYLLQSETEFLCGAVCCFVLTLIKVTIMPAIESLLTGVYFQVSRANHEFEGRNM